MKSISLALISIVALCSCSFSGGPPFEYFENKDPRETYSTATETITGRAVDKRMFYLLLIPTGNTLTTAIERAIEKAGPTCVGLANTKVEYAFGFYLVYCQGTWVVSGNPIYKLAQPKGKKR